MTPPAIELGVAKDYLRVDGGAEDATITRLIEAASDTCEHFTGQTLVARDVVETVAGGAAWRLLAATPVRAITLVEALAADGSASALPVGGYAVDIDAHGDGWVRAPGAARLRVTYRAGLAEAATDLPAALRQGVVRLVAHLHAHRDAIDEGAPPAAVAALWRPFRRIMFGTGCRP